MINPFAEINWQPNIAEIKSFAKTLLIGSIVISFIFFIVSLIKHPVKEAITIPAYIISAGIIIFIISFISPTCLKPLYYIWFFIAASIGIVISNVILLLFFYLFFTVIALGLRIITGRDPLQLKKNAEKKSYWIEKRKKRTLKQYLKQY